jgi:hypothetical protein
MSKLLSNVNVEYVNFVKKFLINRCFSIYCELVYEKNDYDITEYEKKLLFYISDMTIWHEVFIRVRHIFEYYYLITNDTELLYANIVNNSYESNKTFVVYPYQQFQEYLDEKFAYNEMIGWNSELTYKNYLSNINHDENEYNFILKKYKTDIMKKKLKNHLIYIVKLYVSNKANNLVILSEEEKEEIDVCLNIIPYFIYIGMKDLTIDDIDNIEYDSSSFDEEDLDMIYVDFQDLNIEYYEMKFLQTVKKLLL